MNEYIYVGCFVDPGELYPRIRECYPSGLGNTIPFPHVTLDYRPLGDFYTPLFGEPMQVSIVGYGNDGNNEGIKVHLRCRNRTIKRLISQIGPYRTPHITLSVSANAQPKDTGTLYFQKIDKPFTITGYFGAFCKDHRIDTGRVSTVYGPPAKAQRKDSHMNMRFDATVNRETKITASSLTVLKRNASRIANNYYNPIDTMSVTVTDDHGSQSTLEYTRINQVCPDNTIRRGVWK